ncbi:Cadherin domain protein [Marinomonas spartinae]|uniref:Cadherin domain protein n=1 Tax=Marinomonas spartinae TaxID=1792290 RepID=A0A1A8TF35_9GAMM|nr:DUF4347 domain-containing protein [Marinomonas spartinae]SBS30740.1 Cadherin domain protein [Marinomonas spartinae]
MKKHYSNKLGKKMSDYHSVGKKNHARKPLITALEPRLLLDGAAVATAVDVISDAQLHHDATQTDSNHTVTADRHKDISKSVVIAPTEVRAVDPAQNNGRKEVVFIETNVADYQSLVNGTKAGVEVVLLDSSQDGLSQMTEWAKTHSDYDAIHIISHGSEGSVNLGALNLDRSDINGRASDLAQLGAALNEQGDLLLYGCDVASGEGQAFIDSIAQLTQADVAASNDLTGAADLHGDWDLEYHQGHIKEGAVWDKAILDHYHSVLAETISDFSGEKDSPNSGGTGFKSLTDVNLVVGNGVTLDGIDGNGEMFLTDTSDNDATITIKADGVDAASFDVSEVKVYNFGSSGEIVLDSSSTIVFKDKGGAVLRTMTLNGDTSIPSKTTSGAPTASSPLNIFTLFDNNAPVTGVAQIDFNFKCNNAPGINLADLTFTGITYDNVVAPSSGPSVPSTPDLSAASDTGISSTDNITNDTTPTFTVTGVTSGATVTLFNDANNNGVVDAGETLKTGAASGTSIQLTTSSALTSGTYNIKAIQTVGGTDSAATSAQSVTIDTTAPTETIASATFSVDTTANGGTNSDFITKTAEQTVSGTLSENLSSGESVYVSLDNGASWTVATASVGSNTWSLAGQTLTESSTLKVKVTDKAGNDGAVYSQAYVLDTSAPTKTITSAAFSADTAANGGTNSDWITKTASQIVSGTLSANLASGETVYVSLDGGTNWSAATATVGQNTWTLAGQTLTGSNTLKVKVTDTAGNDGEVYNQAYVLDTSAPTKTIASAAFSADTAANGGTNSDWITKTASQTVSGTLSANLASGETVYVSLDGGTNWSAATATVGQNTWTLAGQTLTGSNTLKVKVTDTAGNDGEVYNQAYVLDTSAPTKTIASAAFSADTAANGGTNSDWITKTASQTVSGTLSANLASGETVYVSLDGGTNWSAATATVGQNTWTLAGQTLTGSNTLKVKVTDTAGNDGEVYNQAYVLDTSAPTKTIASAAFSADSAVNGGSIITKTAEQTVSGTLSANLSSGESVYVSLDNGASWTVATASVGSNTWSLAGQTLTESSTLKVKVTDKAGNDGEVYSQNYVLDTTAPTITSITRQTPTGSSTNADSLVYQVAFSEAVSNLDASDFSVAGTTASVTSVSQVGSSNVYNITVSGGDLADLNGTVSLGFSGTQNIQDIVGNAITNTTPTGSNDAKYDVINSLTVTTGDNKNDNATFSDYATDLTDGGGLSLIEAMHYASANQTVSFNLASDFVDMNGQTIELVSGVILDTDLMNGLTISNGTLNLQGSAIVTNGVGDSLTIASTITGNGQSLTKMGDGRLTLSSAINSNSSFSTNVTGGSLSISDNGNLGSGGLTLDGGSLILQNSSDISHDITLGANGGTITVTNSDVTVSGAISGSGALTHTGGRALTLSGNNTFSGGLTLSGSGGVVVADGGNLGGGAVTLSQGLTVTGSSIALANNFVFNGGSITNANNVTISGDISGSGSIEKAGAGTLLLSGAGNSWSGAATVSAGTLSGTTTSLTGDIVNNAAVVFNQNSSGTYSKIISGTGTFTKSGSGAVTLTGENTYTGNTIVSAGELVLNNSNGMALADTSAVALTGTGKLSLSSNETIGNLSGVSGTRVDLGANTLTVNQTNSSSFAGVMSGTGGLIKTGAGTLALSGANTYTGDTTISSGEVFASGGSAIADNSAVTVAAGATFELSTSTSETIGSIAGAGSIAANGGTLTVGGNNTSTTFSGVFSAGSAGAALAKVGSGTLTLSGNNTYSGNTTVSGGTLSLTGSLTNTSEVIVNSGATLAGSGSVFSANSTNTLTVNSGGFLAPGVSGINSGAGGLTVNGNLVLNGTLKADITGSTAKTEYDQVTVKGNVTLGANSAFDIAYSVTSSGNTFELIDNQGSSAITGTLNGVAEGGSLTSNSHSFQTSYVGGTGNDITLKDNAVPVISAVDVTGNLTEGGALTKNGSVTFSDADTTNRPTATKADKSITAKAQDGTTALTLTADQIAALKAAFSISSPSSNTNTGTVNWSFNIAESSIDFLKQGETVTAVFSIIVTDDFNAKATQDVTVTITGTNDAPVITSGATGSVNENAPTSTVIYMATATDAENDTLTYSLTGADAALLNINPSTGAVTLKNSADYETKNTYSFNVVVTDNGTGNLTDSKAVAVSVNDLNDNAPVITSSATGSVNENAPTSTVIYQVTATDADGTAANNTLQYSLSGADANLLDINAVTGAVTLKASADFETKSSYSFNVIATDNGAGNLMGTKVVTVSVNDLNDNAPTVSASTATATLVEAGGINNATLGTSKASITLTKADVDTVGTVHYDAAYLLSNGWSTTNGGLSYSKVGTYGTATLTLATDTVSYELSNSNSDTQALTAGQSVNDSFTIEVTDGNATQTTKAVFNIVGSNDAPIDSGVVASLTAISGQAFSPVTLPANLFKDLDSGETSKLVWRVENLPTGMLFNAETHTISGKPVGGFEGVNTLQIIATDPHGAEVKVPITLTISPAPVIAPVVPTIIPTPQAEPQGTTVQLDAPTTTTTPLPTGTIASEQGVSGFAGAPAINANINTIDNGNINVGNSVPNAIGTGQPATVISTSRVAVDVGADGQVQVTPTSGVAANTTGLSIANLSTQPDRVSIAIADTGLASNYSATLSDGSTLPSWVQVDPVTGEVSMTPPPGQGKISLKINAVDANGNTRVLEVDLDLDKLPTSPQGQQSTEPAPASAAGNGVTFMSLDEQLNKAASQLDDYGRDLMKLLVS